MRNAARLPDLQPAILPDALLDAEHHLQAVGECERSHRLRELRQGLGEPDLRVVVFGEFNRGKSTLINALLGRIVLPAKLVPTTGHVTQVVYGSSERIRVRYVDQREEVFALDHLESISSLDVNGAAREDVDLLEVSVQHPLLQRKIALIDTPGLNEKEAQTRRARNAIAKADLVMLVLDARGLLNQRERDLAVDWLSERLRKPVVLVVNFMNFLSEQECRDVRKRLDTWTRSHLDPVLGRPWFEVNARGALLQALDHKAEPTADDFARLRDALAACEGSPRAALQQRSRRGQLLAELCEAGAENHRVLQSLQNDVAAVERERARRREDLEEQIRRFDANAAGRRDQVCLFAQRSLANHLPHLLFWLKNATKETLAVNAGSWYDTKLSEAVAEIEKHAGEVLHGLAVGNPSQPAPFTIKEHLILGARIAVNVPANAANGNAIGAGAGIGGLLGTVLIPIPVVGTAIGAFIGGLLAKHLGPPPDYGAAYSTSAQERWRTDAQKVTTLLESQLDARIGELKRELVRQLESVQLATVGHERTRGEVELRQALAEALNDCESLLHAN